ncbi:hypothetical protein ONE63_008767 [Megalurothrips usitatus]|uniref:Uncharacterized protein n=1 Tax=Megalurothrips usitatus TaxID=439358 RepID=A0AAV7XU54_9NEOP|nr:hypothetical protein ONE63_008767 [Megalurothrips usitatus]
MLNGNGKRPSPDHWDSSPSHSDSATAAPPLTPSPGPNPHHYTVISNGYSSPMSSGSYDPYSPNGKIGECDKEGLWPVPRQCDACRPRLARARHAPVESGTRLRRPLPLRVGGGGAPMT